MPRTLFKLKRTFRRWYWRRKRNRIYVGLVSLLLVGGISYVAFFAAPHDFPSGLIVQVPEGSSIRDTAKIFKDKHLISSELLFEAIVKLEGGSLIAGEYSFQQRESVLSVGNRLAKGDFKIVPIRVRVVEGSTVRGITNLLQKDIPDFDSATFLKLAQAKERYLFPDTYFILPGSSAESILSMMEDNFNDQVNAPNVREAIQHFGKPLSDVIIMASLLEKEVPKTSDRRLIAGILWRRIELGMPLQVDAVFPYIIGKNSFNLTKADLMMDSPYNTYTNKGLPIGPIASPSLDAILAAVTPIESDYLFYLSDKDGNMHYSVTYAQHLAAKHKYLGT